MAELGEPARTVLTFDQTAELLSAAGDADFAALRAAPVGDTGAATPPDAAPVADLPLWALLARPLLAFTRQYEAEPGPSLAISANVLRVLPDPGVHTKDIPALGGVSRESVAMPAFRPDREVWGRPAPG